jgi:hypothetical protein
MTKTLSTFSYTRTDSLPFSGGTAENTYETKERFVGSSSLNTNLPFLSGKQLSILGALAINRSGR